MTNIDIYDHISKQQFEQFEPTFLYIKRHTITGKLYFGKTIKNPEKYHGSGKYWTNHIKKHGKEHIENVWYCYFTNAEMCIKTAIQFSIENDIVNSDLWANKAIEAGVDYFTDKTINCGKTPWNKGKKMTEEYGEKVTAGKIGKSNGHLGMHRSEETKLNIKTSLINSYKETPMTEDTKHKISIGGRRKFEHSSYKELYPNAVANIKKTNLERYGMEYPTLSKENKAKRNLLRNRPIVIEIKTLMKEKNIRLSDLKVSNYWAFQSDDYISNMKKILLEKT